MSKHRLSLSKEIIGALGAGFMIVITGVITVLYVVKFCFAMYSPSSSQTPVNPIDEVTVQAAMNVLGKE